ncbi:MAG: hypothetical protein LN588_05685 [Rickettsia endosymbiont of Bryobia graminum]|nr:hypothetical protein [Rickettsia endosymbiont of Bryobia graminum]
MGIFPAACGVIWRNEQIYIHKSHNVTVLLYHMVFLARYRGAVFYGAVDAGVGGGGVEREQRYRIEFLERGVEQKDVHFGEQSVRP